MRDGAAFLVRRVTPDDSVLLRAIRLRALASDPVSFSATHAKEAALPDGEWEAVAARNARGDQTAIFLAVQGEQALGMAGGVRLDGEPGVFQVWGMWVAPAARGKGVGRWLLAAVERWARLAGGRVLRLWVPDSTKPAWRLYLAAGFRPDGMVVPHRHVPGRTGHRMMKAISSNCTARPPPPRPSGRVAKAGQPVVDGGERDRPGAWSSGSSPTPPASSFRFCGRVRAPAACWCARAIVESTRHGEPSRTLQPIPSMRCRSSSSTVGPALAHSKERLQPLPPGIRGVKPPRHRSGGHQASRSQVLRGR